MTDPKTFVNPDEDWSDFGSQSLGGSLRSYSGYSGQRSSQDTIDPALLTRSNFGGTPYLSAPEHYQQQPGSNLTSAPEANLETDLEFKPKRNRAQAGQATVTKGARRPRKNKNMTDARAPRCARCIMQRKSCNGQKPVCGLCASIKNGTAQCVWPEGDPTREEMEKILQASVEDTDQTMTSLDDDGGKDASVGVRKTKKAGNAKKPAKRAGKVIEDGDESENENDIGELSDFLCELPKGVDYTGVDFKLAKQIAEDVVASRPLHTEGLLAGLPDFSEFKEKPLPPGEEGERQWKAIEEGFLRYLDTGLPGWKPPQKPEKK